MKVRFAVVWAFVAATTLLGLGSASASSASPNTPDGAAIAQKVFASSNPQAAYSVLPTADRAAFDKVEIVATTQTSATTQTLSDIQTRAVLARGAASGMQMMAAASTTCWGMHISGSSKNALGGTLYTFWQETDVCSNGSQITKVNMPGNLIGEETSTPGWRTDGTHGNAVNAGWEGRGVGEFHFILGAGPWDIQHANPCDQIRINANHRTFSSSSSCNPN